MQYDNLLVNKPEHETQSVNVSYTDNQKLVQDSIIQDVLAESEIQKVTIANDKALELYDQGNHQAAEKMLMDNKSRLEELSGSMKSAALKARLDSQIENNNIMAEAVLNEDEFVSRKIITEKQFRYR